MISRIKGKLRERKDASILLEAGAITYEVMIPPAVMTAIPEPAETELELIVYHYHQLEPSRSYPVMIGFMNEVEKEFFEKFITVSGVGPKAACRALALPFSEIADAIDAGDTRLLKSLPGIGERKAKEIIASLQGKVGKFGLIQDKAGVRELPKIKEDLKEEAVTVLLQLQYKKKEAEDMVDKAFSRNPDVRSVEDLLNEVYRQKSAAGIRTA
jgi:Holliday junction DNA helicase RuvA